MRIRRAYRLNVQHFMKTLGIAALDELRQTDHRCQHQVYGIERRPESVAVLRAAQAKECLHAKPPPLGARLREKGGKRHAMPCLLAVGALRFRPRLCLRWHQPIAVP